MIKKVSVGGFATYVLTVDGAVYACGYNDFGQLGDGTFVNKSVLTPMIGEGAVGVEDIVGGYREVIFLKGGAVYFCGYDDFGQAGTGGVPQLYATPVAAVGEGASGVDAIALGAAHALILKSGTVYSTGHNVYGQLGNGLSAARNTYGITTGAGASGVDGISAGFYSSYISKSGALYACGSNVYGQLGINTTLHTANFTAMVGQGASGITAFEGYQSHMAALKGDKLYCTGYNASGQLGDGTLVNKKQLTAAVGEGVSGVTSLGTGNRSDKTFIIKSGAIYWCGYNLNGDAGSGNTLNSRYLIPMINEGTSLCTGVSNTADGNTAVLRYIKPYACGKNTRGQLGDGTLNPSTVLVSMTF